MKHVSNVIICAGVVALLATGIYLAIRNETASATSTFGFGFLLVVLLLLAKFKRFKGFGFEAEMWEEKQEEAAALIASLKKIQLAYAKAVFGIVADPDVAVSPSKYAKRDEIKKAILEEAEKGGLSEEQIREILDTEKLTVCSTYASAVYSYAHKYLKGVGTDEFQAKINPVMQSHPSPDLLNSILDDCDIHDTVTRAFVDDYRHYLKTGRHRRPEIWATRGEWMTRYIGWDK